MNEGGITDEVDEVHDGEEGFLGFILNDRV